MKNINEIKQLLSGLKPAYKTCSNQLSSEIKATCKELMVLSLKERFYTADEIDKLLACKLDIICDLSKIRENSLLGSTALLKFEESDPSIPLCVKNITLEDIDNWNSSINPEDDSLDSEDDIPLKIEINNEIKSPNLDNLILLGTYLTLHLDISTKLDKLTPGEYISISKDNVIDIKNFPSTGSDITVDPELDRNSPNPVLNSAIVLGIEDYYLDTINEVNRNYLKKLQAGTGISIDENNRISVKNWGQQQLFENGDSSVYIVDLNKYNITEGYIQGHFDDSNLQAPLYTELEYTTMYNNGVGFSKAFQDAKLQGYNCVRIPKGEYCLTPTYAYDEANINSNTPIKVGTKGKVDDTDPRINLNASIWLVNISDLTIDFGGSTFHMLLDSYNKSKYYNIELNPGYSSSFIPYSYSLMRILLCDHITLKNGIFKGGKYTRKFTYQNKESQSTSEGGYGILAHGRDSHDIVFDNLEGSGFEADFIGFGGRSDKTYFAPNYIGENLKYIPTKTTSGTGGGLGYTQEISGIVNTGSRFKDTFDSKTSKLHHISYDSATGYALSKIYKVSPGFNASSPEWIKKERGKRRFTISNNLGTTRIPNCYTPSIEVLTYNLDTSSGTSVILGPLRIIPCGYLDSFTLLDKETHILLQFKYEFGLNEGQYRGKNPELSTIFLTISNESETDDSYENQGSSSGPSTDEEDPEENVENNTGSDVNSGGPCLHIVNGLMYNIFVRNCYIHDNGRGGCCPSGDSVIIENCTFGKRTKSINGVPKFPSNGTTKSDLILGTYPEWWGSTNYHINCEDYFPSNMTIRNCTFYGGAIMMPTILRLSMYDNKLYGTTGPSIKNSYHVYMANNTFSEGGSTTTNSYTPNFGATLSKQQIVKNVISTGNTFFARGGSHAGNQKYVKGSVSDSSIVISECSTGSNVDPLIAESPVTDCTYSNCTIKCEKGATDKITSSKKGLPYFNKLINCKLESYPGQGYIAVTNLNNCKIDGPIIYIIPNYADIDSNGVLHCYIKDTSTIINPFNVLIYSFSSKKLVRDIVVHYDNCKIDMTNISTSTFNEYVNTDSDSNLAPNVFSFAFKAPVKGKTTYLFNNCTFVSSSLPSATKNIIRRPNYDLVQYLTYKEEKVSDRHVLKIGDDPLLLIGDSVYLPGVVGSGVDYSLEVSQESLTALLSLGITYISAGTYTKLLILALTTSTRTELDILNSILQAKTGENYIPILFRIKCPYLVEINFNSCTFDLYSENGTSYLFYDFNTLKGIDYDSEVSQLEKTNKLVVENTSLPKKPAFKITCNNCRSNSKVLFTEYRKVRNVDPEPKLLLNNIPLDSLILCSNNPNDLEYFGNINDIKSVYDLLQLTNTIYIRTNNNTNLDVAPIWQALN